MLFNETGDAVDILRAKLDREIAHRRQLVADAKILLPPNNCSEIEQSLRAAEILYRSIFGEVEVSNG